MIAKKMTQISFENWVEFTTLGFFKEHRSWVYLMKRLWFFSFWAA